MIMGGRVYIIYIILIDHFETKSLATSPVGSDKSAARFVRLLLLRL